MVNERDYGYKHVPGHLHIQEVSEDSTIAEHKLSELVSPTRRLPASDHRISQPLPLRSHTQSYLPTPQSYHHASNLPAAHRTSPSPPLSSGSGPTVLQSFPSWDPTWRSGRVDEDGRAFTTHVPSGHLDLVYPTHGDVETRSEGHTKYRHNAAEPYLGGWVRDDNHSGEARPYSYETPLDEGYRLGVGFGDNTGPNSKGRLSEERKAKRLRALQREFGISAPSTSHNQSTSGSSRPAKYTDTASAYKRLRNKQKQEEKALEEEVGVDRQGNLIVYHARKWRVAARWLQSLLALTAAVCGIGGNAVRAFCIAWGQHHRRSLTSQADRVLPLSFRQGHPTRSASSSTTGSTYNVAPLRCYRAHRPIHAVHSDRSTMDAAQTSKCFTSAAARSS